MNEVAFSGDRGFAAGELGTLLRTSDGGASWNGVSTGLVVNLSALQMIGRDTVFVAGECALRRSDDGGQTFRRLAWVATESGCRSPIVSLSFANGLTGFLLLKDGSVMRTSDGGRSFARKTSVLGQDPQSVAFTTPTTGFVVSKDGRIYRTTDGASSWVQVADTRKQLASLSFVSESTGYAVGAGLTVYKTIDGGTTWSAVHVTGVPAADITRLRCAGSELCLASVADGTQLLRTTDGGTTWSSVVASSSPIFAAAFATAARAVAVGGVGATAVSDSAGVTWSGASTPPLGDFRGVDAASDSVAWYYGERGALALTTDGGTTLRSVDLPTSVAVLGADFADGTVGYAIDADHALYRTTDGGDGWSLLNYGARSAFDFIAVNGGESVILGGPAGLRRSVDSGATFQTLTGGVLSKAKPNKFYANSSGVLTGFSKSRILLSTDFGGSWRQVGHPAVTKRMSRRFRAKVVARNPLLSVSFFSESGGIALARGKDSDHLWETSNGGRSWRSIEGIGVKRINRAAFADAENGYVVPDRVAPKVAPGYVFSTTDSGHTWIPQLVAPRSDVFVVPTSQRSAFAAGVREASSGPDSLLVTRSNGFAGRGSSMSLSTAKRVIKVKSARSARIKVSVEGKLTPALGGELVMLRSKTGFGVWNTTLAEVASNGTFTVEYLLRGAGTTTFVAQSSGGAGISGSASDPLTVTLRARHR